MRANSKFYKIEIPPIHTFTNAKSVYCPAPVMLAWFQRQMPHQFFVPLSDVITIFFTSKLLLFVFGMYLVGSSENKYYIYIGSVMPVATYTHSSGLEYRYLYVNS